jgi:hypothetical protein
VPINGPFLTHVLTYRKPAVCERAATGGSVLGCCWPSLLGALLAPFAQSAVRDLLAGIDALLLESLDLPDAWRLYGPRQVTKMLDQLGIRRQEA